MDVPLAYLFADSDALADIILASASLPSAKQRKLAEELRRLTNDEVR